MAVSDPDGVVAMPLDTLHVSDEAEAVRRILEVCGEKEADLVVVGMPVNMDGTQGAIYRKADAFRSKLTEALDIPVEGWDERMSSISADRVLDEAEIDNRERKGKRDRIAAQVILQAYLDAKI